MWWLPVILTCFLGCDGHSVIYQHYVQPVVERMTWERWGSDRFRLVRVYAAKNPPLRACPFVADYYEWRGNVLYYTQTDDWYNKVRTRYIPGHRWFTKTEVLAYATAEWTLGIVETLVDEDNDCNAERVIPRPQDSGRHLIWHAVQPDGDRRRLDQFTCLHGNCLDTWKESWWYVPDDSAPVETKGWRNNELRWHGLSIR